MMVVDNQSLPLQPNNKQSTNGPASTTTTIITTPAPTTHSKILSTTTLSQSAGDTIMSALPYSSSTSSPCEDSSNLTPPAISSTSSEPKLVCHSSNLPSTTLAIPSQSSTATTEDLSTPLPNSPESLLSNSPTVEATEIPPSVDSPPLILPSSVAPEMSSSPLVTQSHAHQATHPTNLEEEQLNVKEEQSLQVKDTHHPIEMQSSELSKESFSLGPRQEEVETADQTETLVSFDFKTTSPVDLLSSNNSLPISSEPVTNPSSGQEKPVLRQINNPDSDSSRAEGNVEDQVVDEDRDFFEECSSFTCDRQNDDEKEDNLVPREKSPLDEEETVVKEEFENRQGFDLDEFILQECTETSTNDPTKLEEDGLNLRLLELNSSITISRPVQASSLLSPDRRNRRCSSDDDQSNCSRKGSEVGKNSPDMTKAKVERPDIDDDDDIVEVHSNLQNSAHSLMVSNFYQNMDDSNSHRNSIEFHTPLLQDPRKNFDRPVGPFSGPSNALPPQDFFKHPSPSFSVPRRKPLLEPVYVGPSTSSNIGDIYNDMLKYSVPGRAGTSSGNKAFLCPLCNKTFEWASLLNTHLRVHTGEKPYCCPKCPYRSTQKGNVQRHLYSRHPEQSLPSPIPNHSASGTDFS